MGERREAPGTRLSSAPGARPSSRGAPGRAIPMTSVAANSPDPWRESASLARRPADSRGDG